MSMPPLNANEKEIKKLFKEVNKVTNNFQKLKPKMLIENPKRLLILRLALGMSQNKFEGFIGNENKNITKYECGKIKKMQLRTAANIIEKIEGKLKSTSLNVILKNFKKSKKESQGWFKAYNYSRKLLEVRRKGAIESLKKRMTSQEQSVSQLLTKLKIEHKVNFAISNSIIVDVYIPNKKLAIECKHLTSILRRELKEQVQKLAYKGYKLRFNFPNLMLWALIKTKQKLTYVEMEELQGPFDKVFTNFSKFRSELSY